jgi:hypothetical protein
MHTWNPDTIYQPGDVVLHNGEPYQKLDDGDNSPPDHVPGGWLLVENNNLPDYQAIEASFNSYEQRVAAHRAEVLAKLQAEGLSPDDVKAVLNA